MTLALLLSAALALASSAQSQAADSIAVRRVLDSARALHLPEAPLRSLINEGRQRKEPTTRIVSALWSYVDALQQSRAALGARASDDEIDAGASVILSGAPAKTLAAVRSARPQGDLTVALVVLADLVERGVPLTRAEDAVVTLARVGTTDAAFNAFRVGVQKDLASGQGAESALIKRTREIVTQMNAGSGRRQNSFEIREAALVLAPEPASTITTSDALSITDNGARTTQARWNFSATSTPFASFSALALHTSAAGTLYEMSTPGNTTAEVISALGIRRDDAGFEGGLGAAAFSGMKPRLPFAYAAGWRTLQGIHLKFEARLAGGRSSAAVSRDLERLEVAFASGDTAIGGINPPPVVPPGTDTVPQYAAPSATATVSELRFDASRTFGRFGTDASGGIRFVNERPFDSWNSFSVSTPVAAHLGAIVGFTTQRAMTLSSTPTGSHLFAGFRFMPRGREPEAIPQSLFIAPVMVTASLVELGGALFFEYRGTASSVDVRGDFSSWEPRPMTRVSAGVWRIALEPRAMYKLSVRVDGGEWMVPAGMARARSAFGDEVGVVAITPDASK